MIVGVGGGEYGIRGFIAAYDVGDRTGGVALLHDSRAWRARFGDVGALSAPDRRRFCDPEAWKHGGGSIWLTGSYDPRLNLTYWGVGNVGPDYNGDAAARRQPLHRLGRRARRRHRQAEVALPVHAARRLRLRLGADPRARRQLGGQPRQRRSPGRTATATSTCSIARRDDSCSASRS